MICFECMSKASRHRDAIMDRQTNGEREREKRRKKGQEKTEKKRDFAL